MKTVFLVNRRPKFIRKTCYSSSKLQEVYFNRSLSSCGILDSWVWGSSETICHCTSFLFICLNTVYAFHPNCIFSKTRYSCIFSYLALTFLWKVRQNELLFLKIKITPPQAYVVCASEATLVRDFFLPNKHVIVEIWILRANS